MRMNQSIGKETIIEDKSEDWLSIEMVDETTEEEPEPVVEEEEEEEELATPIQFVDVNGENY